MTDILQDWSDDWKTILVRDQFKCVYCGLDGTEDVNAFRQLVLCFDHLVPRSQNGSDLIDNKVTCCWACNRAKSGFDPREPSDEKVNNREQLRSLRIARVQRRLRETDHLSDYFCNVLRNLKGKHP